MPGGGEAGHIQADLGDDGLSACSADTGDFVQALSGGQDGGVRASPGARAGGAIGVNALGGRDAREQFFDASGEPADLGAQGVDLV